MASQDSGMAVGWNVTNQTEGTQPSPAGPLTKGFNVFFTTTSGLSGSVFVPESQYTPEVVREAIAKKVAAMTAVSSLSG